MVQPAVVAHLKRGGVELVLGKEKRQGVRKEALTDADGKTDDLYQPFFGGAVRLSWSFQIQRGGWGSLS